MFDSAVALCVDELCNLPRFMCVNERGVAYRHSRDKFDRYEQVRGPESGQVMVALDVWDNWIRVAVDEKSEKFLPLRLSGETLFERVDNRRQNPRIEQELKQAIEALLVRITGRPVEEGAGEVGMESAAAGSGSAVLLDVLGVLQAQLVASVLSRDIASRKPALKQALERGPCCVVARGGRFPAATSVDESRRRRTAAR